MGLYSLHLLCYRFHQINIKGLHPLLLVSICPNYEKFVNPEDFKRVASISIHWEGDSVSTPTVTFSSIWIFNFSGTIDSDSSTLVFPEIPILAYSRPNNLADDLVRARLKGKGDEEMENTHLENENSPF